jgi:hypothetical protein
MNKPLKEHYEVETDLGVGFAIKTYLRDLESYVEFLESRVSGKYIKVSEMKSIREGKGLTLRDVEIACGISNAYLSQLENGKITNPSFRVVEALHNFYCYGTKEGMPIV